MNAAPEDKSGAASGVNNAASRLAGVIAVAIIGALASRVYLAGAPAGAPRFGLLPAGDDPLRLATESAFLSAYAVGMAFVAIGALLAAVAAFWSLPRGGADAQPVVAEPA
ncbi:MAG: MFS transporter [Hyphomicrobiales bacterium]|nr:MFS transporter [Hyphomicrobiales bacterium]